MEETDNAINEDRIGGEAGEKEWTVPSAPQPSPEKSPPEGAISNPVEPALLSNNAKNKDSDEKIQILRFTVTKVHLHTPSVNTKNNAVNTASAAAAQKQVVQRTETDRVSGSICNPNITTNTTPIKKTGRRPEDLGKKMQVAGTQTKDLGQHMIGRTLTAPSVLHETIKELETTTAAASKTGTYGRFHQQGKKYCLFCFTVLAVLCLFLAFIWVLTLLSTNTESPAPNITLQTKHSLARSGQFNKKKEVLYDETATEFSLPVMEYKDTEDSSHLEDTNDVLQQSNVSHTNNEKEQTPAEGVNGTEGMRTTKDEQLKENTDKEPYKIMESIVEHEESEDLDNLRLEDDQPTNTAEIKPKIFHQIYLKSQQCQREYDVLLAKYVDFYHHLLRFFRVFGIFAMVQGKMLESRLLSLNRYIRGEDSQHYITLTMMVHFEDMTGRIGSVSPFSGTTIFTCLHRHLQFMNRCFANILTIGPDVSLFHAFRAAYQDVLAMHHAWFVENFYMAGMSMVPTKQEALKLFSLAYLGRDEKASPEKLHEAISFVMKGLENLTEVSETVLRASNALHKIPKQVIT